MWVLLMLTRPVPLVEQELFTLPEHMSSPRFQWETRVRVTRSLVLCDFFCRSLFVLLAIVLSVLLRFTDSDYSFGISVQTLLVPYVFSNG